jgi:hypothetical protein
MISGKSNYIENGRDGRIRVGPVDSKLRGLERALGWMIKACGQS